MLLFLHETHFTGYAVRDNIPNVISALEETGEKFLIWLFHNQMKLKTDKCYILLNTQDQNFLKIGDFNIKNSLFLTKN